MPLFHEVAHCMAEPHCSNFGDNYSNLFSPNFLNFYNMFSMI